MPERFSDDPGARDTRVWRHSGWKALGSGFAFVLLGLIGVGVALVFGFAIAGGSFGGTLATILASLFALAFVGAMGAMCWLLWRDVRGKLGSSIRLTPAGIALQLRASRSLIHDPPACQGTVAWPDVTAIQTRLEAYRSQGMVNVQRSYRLVRRNGPPIFLFEERSIDTNFATASMAELAAEIAMRAGVEVSDLGFVEGRGGVLGAWRATPIPWTAAPVTEERQEALRRRLALTMSVLSAAMMLAWIVRTLASMHQ